MIPAADRSIAAVTIVLAVLAGTALWFNIGYEPDAGSHRIAVTLPARAEQEGAPRITIHLGHGVVAEPGQVDADGFEWSDDGTMSAPLGGGTATYSGPVGSIVHIEWVGGSSDTTMTVRIDGGSPATVDVPAGGAGFEEISFGLAMPRSAWLLLGLLVVWMLLPAQALARRLLADGGRPSRLVGPITLAAAGAALLVWGLPLDEARTQVVTIEVEALGPSPLGSQGAETWVRIAGPEGDNPLATQLGHPRWLVRDPFVVGSPDSGVLRGEVSVGPDDRLEFASISHSGLARVTIDGTATMIDTFEGPVSIGFGSSATGASALLRATAWLTTFLALVAGLLLVGLAVGDRRPSRTAGPGGGAEPIGASAQPPYWLLPQLVWTTALVVLWPGLMSPDSLSQWHEARTGELSDWHPYTTTVLMGLLRVIVDSPWLPILVTVTAASLALGGLARLASANGCRPGVVLASLLAASASPALLLMGVVLWKDVIMGVALLVTTLVVWRSLDDPHWLARRRNLVVAVAALSMVWLSRHNGWPVVVAVLVTLSLLRPALRRPVAGLAATVIAVALIVEVPLARVLDVEPNPTGEIAFMQRISAHVGAGTELDEAERALLEGIRPLDQPWPYDCATVQPTWAGPDSIPLADYAGRQSELVRLAVGLTVRNPGVEIDHLRCSTRLLWQLSDQGSSTFLVESGGRDALRDTIPTWFTDSPMEGHPSRRLASRSLDWLLGLPSPVHRPALYLLPFGLLTVAASVRRRSLDPLLIASPAFFQTMSIAPFVLVQDTRFLFGSMLVAAALIPLFATVERPDGSGRPLSWRSPPITDREPSPNSSNFPQQPRATTSFFVEEDPPIEVNA